MTERTQWSGALKRRTLLTGAALGAAALTIPGFAGRAFAQSEGGIFRIAHHTIDLDWSPLLGSGSFYPWRALAFASPMYFDTDGVMHPLLFTSWSANESATRWAFEIATGAKFSDGSPVTAEDVKGSWELNAMPSSKNQRVDQCIGTVEGFAAVANGSATDLPGVIVTGEKTFEVALTSPDPVFAQKLANQLVPVVKAAVVRDADGNAKIDWWMPQNGLLVTGPFKPVSMDLASGRIVYERNEHWFGPAPKLTGVELVTVEDPVVAVAMLQRGEFHASTELRVPTLVQDLGLPFSSGPEIPKGQHFWFNVNRAPTDDKNVRQALILAVDREGLRKVTIGDGPFVKADQILNGVPGVDPAYEPYPYDPDLARKHLAESTYGSAEHLPTLLMAGIVTPMYETAGQYIAEQWRQNLGISAVQMKASIDAFAGPDQGSVQIFRDDVGTRVPDAVVYLMGTIHSSCSNAKTKLGGFADAEIDGILDQAAMLSVDDPGRIAGAQQAQQLFREQYAYLPWHFEVSSRWALESVGGFEKNLDSQVVEPWLLTAPV